MHEALQCNDTFKVYTRMAEIHQANNKHDVSEDGGLEDDEGR